MDMAGGGDEANAIEGSGEDCGESTEIREREDR